MAEQKQLKFALGFVGMTQGVNEFMGEKEGRQEQIASILYRHQSGDWGEVPEEDKQANERALTLEERLLSRYTIDGESFYVITEWDRSVTTIMLRDEY